MDSTGIDDNESSVDEGAFWHTNMDLYYGYMPGEIVEVEHEPGKYWMARIQYSYKHLILLEWLGKYGEFWFETSTSNAATSLSNTLVESSIPKRLFPLGHHLQPQIRSQFILEKPTKILVAPSLYNPACDPYANIKNVDDLLAHDDEEDIDKDGALVNKSGNANLELALACKKKIQYRQEDVDELETALQNLDETDYDESATQIESPDTSSVVYKSNTTKESSDKRKTASSKGRDRNQRDSSKKDSGIDSEASNVPASALSDRSGPKTSSQLRKEVYNQDREYDLMIFHMCHRLELHAKDFGRYMGIDETHKKFTDEWFVTKPKQFFDLGGVNHEKLLVPGTLLEVSHTRPNCDGQPELYFWFAFVIKNTGGRLTLRWFLCDEPKFKQGRLELKSSRSRMVIEESDSTDDQSGSTEKSPEVPGSVSKPTADGIPAKSLTFSLHFCHPRIHNLRYADKRYKLYALPQIITDHLERLTNMNDRKIRAIKHENHSHIFDTRRTNLDKDRPLIDHILNVAKFKAPAYIDIVFSQDSVIPRDVLVSCPKLTKLLRAKIVRELDAGVFEIHSYQIQEDDESIKFIYPFDSSYAVLPLDWSINNEDCLSVDPSRNPTPDQSKQNTDNNDKVVNHQNCNAHISRSNTGVDNRTCSCDKTIEEVNSRACLKLIRKAVPKPGAPFTKVPQEFWSALTVDIYPGFSGYNAQHWSEALHDYELRTKAFHCCIDSDQRQAVESRFKVMDQLEITHPFSDSTICLGRIRKVVFPLLWVQLSTDCFTIIPFNSTDIYPSGWCNANNHKLVSMLPPRKRCSDQGTQANSKKRKKVKTADPKDEDNEQFNLGDIYDRQLDFDYILQEKNNYIKIYFNHKCFTGPSLSKSKICSLPQYVGPGPMHLVLEEVVTRIISVAYVPPRLLNELSSKSFEELLVSRSLTNTKNHTFKAKYQKRVHRERVPVCLSPKDIALYCELICEHIKCCYNLFGPALFDGDDCPSHCRSLTKSNKFMKRATYYREKARQGDYLASEPVISSDSKKTESSTKLDKPNPSRPRQTGRRSSDSTNSSVASRLDQGESRASSSSGEADTATNDLRESLKVVMEENELDKNEIRQTEKHDESIWRDQKITPDLVISKEVGEVGMDPKGMAHGTFLSIGDGGENVIYPEDWHVDDVARWLGIYELEMFQSSIKAEGIDGQALLLLDQDSIREHFQNDPRIQYTSDEIDRLWKFVAMIQSNQPKSRPTPDHRTEACRIRKLQN